MVTEIVIAIIALAVVLGGVVPAVTVHLIKKGVNVQPMLEKADGALTIADKVADGITAIAPTAPGVVTVDKIIEWSQKMVESEEQMVKSKQILPDQRKEKAAEQVRTCLTSAGITITPEYEKIIDGAIEGAVDLLPETGEDVKAAAVAALTPKTQSEAVDSPVVSDDVPAVQETHTATPAVTIDQLNQAQTIISAAIAEKTAAQAPTECETAASGTTGAGQASV